MKKKILFILAMSFCLAQTVYADTNYSPMIEKGSQYAYIITPRWGGTAQTDYQQRKTTSGATGVFFTEKITGDRKTFFQMVDIDGNGGYWSDPVQSYSARTELPSTTEHRKGDPMCLKAKTVWCNYNTTVRGSWKSN